MVPARLLDSLPQRPPTPPRDAHAERDVDDEVDEALEILRDSFEIEDALKLSSTRQSLVDTPAQSPHSAVDQPSISAGKAAKKVDFSPWNEYNRPSGDCSQGKTTPVKALPPSRQLKPRRSILKPFAPSPSPLSTPQSSADQAILCSSRQFDSFSDTMDAILQQMAAADRHLRLDAYAALLNSLKGERNSSEIEALNTHLPQLSDFLLRDLSAINPTTNTCDGSLIAQACKTLCGLMHISSVGESFQDEFCASIIRRCISVLEDQTMPKTIVSHFIFVLHEQNFSPRIITIERGQRIIDALQFIDERIKGNSIYGNRIYVYKRLSEQKPDLMVSRMEDWLEHLFHAMLSSVTDLRIRAIQAGTAIAIALGNSSEASMIVDALFKHEPPDSKSYGHFICDKLRDMLDRKLVTEGGNAAPNVEETRSVPQIWRVVILLLRSRRHRLEHWKYLKPWLNVIQGCFNSKDVQTRYQASLAWNAFVYVVMPERDASTTLMDTLKRPIVPFLMPKGNDKNSKLARKYGLGSYLNLLYYAFRPTVAPADKSHYWTTFVVEVLEKLAAKGNNDADTACNILIALFGGFESRMWNENRIHESPHIIRPQELPVLDPKWIRQNIKIVFDAVWPVLKLARWASSTHPITETPAFRMWSLLMTALQNAGSKEITASQELKDAISHLLNFLHLVSALEEDLLPGDTDSTPFEFFQLLTETAMRKVGPLHFSNHILRRGLSFTHQVTPTSSHSRSKSDALESPLEHLILLIANRQGDPGASKRALSLVHICLEAINGTQLQRTLLGGLASAFKSNWRHLQTDTACKIWPALAQLTATILEDSASTVIQEAPQLLEPGYRALLQMLRSGLYFGPHDEQGALHQLFNAVARIVQAEIGTGAKTLLVIRPLCKDIGSLIQSDNFIHRQNCVLLTAFLLRENYEYESDRNVRRAQKSLYGEASRPNRDVLPYELILNILPTIVGSAYNDVSLSEPQISRFLFQSLDWFMEQLPRTFVSKALSKLQGSIRQWVADPEHRLNYKSKQGESELHELRTVVSCTTARPTPILTKLDPRFIPTEARSHRIGWPM